MPPHGTTSGIKKNKTMRGQQQQHDELWINGSYSSLEVHTAAGSIWGQTHSFSCGCSCLHCPCSCCAAGFPPLASSLRNLSLHRLKEHWETTQLKPAVLKTADKMQADSGFIWLAVTERTLLWARFLMPPGCCILKQSGWRKSIYSPDRGDYLKC